MAKQLHTTTDAFEGEGPQRRPAKRLGGRLEEVAEAVGGWGRLLSVTNAVAAGACGQGDSGWAQAGRPGGGGPPLPMHPYPLCFNVAWQDAWHVFLSSSSLPVPQWRANQLEREGTRGGGGWGQLRADYPANGPQARRLCTIGRGLKGGGFRCARGV